MKSSDTPKSYRDLCRAFDTLPGIGELGAQRLVEWLVYHGNVQALSESLMALQALPLCSFCNRLADLDGCSCRLTADEGQQSLSILIVETEKDMACVRDAGYRGQIYVLHGVLSPARGIGPEQLKLQNLLLMLENMGGAALVLPLADSVEGRATAEFIQRKSSLQGKILTMKDLLAELQGTHG